jgi:hypothetical protein
VHPTFHSNVEIINNLFNLPYAKTLARFSSETPAVPYFCPMTSGPVSCSLDHDFLYAVLQYAQSCSFLPDHSLIPAALVFIAYVNYADFLLSTISDPSLCPFFSTEFLPERALTYCTNDVYFSLVSQIADNCTPLLTSSDYLSDVYSLSFVLYNVTFFHLIFLGFLFTIVIVVVISLLLNRNLYVKRQSSFEQSSSSIDNNIFLR